MTINNVDIVGTSYQSRDLILDKMPKVVFVGRSNVGKSSLINKLVNRKGLAKTSSTPGKTVSINYYLIDRHYYFIDLPGYGYAKISKQDSRRVNSLMTQFFKVTHNIRSIILLIDSRRGFMESDIDMLAKILEKDCPILTVLTKSDKIKNSVLKTQIRNLQENFEITAIPFSIKNETSREEILKYISNIIKE